MTISVDGHRHVSVGAHNRVVVLPRFGAIEANAVATDGGVADKFQRRIGARVVSGAASGGATRVVGSSRVCTRSTVVRCVEAGWAVITLRAEPMVTAVASAAGDGISLNGRCMARAIRGDGARQGAVRIAAVATSAARTTRTRCVPNRAHAALQARPASPASADAAGSNRSRHGLCVRHSAICRRDAHADARGEPCVACDARGTGELIIKRRASVAAGALPHGNARADASGQRDSTDKRGMSIAISRNRAQWGAVRVPAVATGAGCTVLVLIETGRAHGTAGPLPEVDAVADTSAFNAADIVCTVGAIGRDGAQLTASRKCG